MRNCLVLIQKEPEHLSQDKTNNYHNMRGFFSFTCWVMALEFILFCIPLTLVITTDTFGTQSQEQLFVASKLIFIPFPLTEVWQILFKVRTRAAILLIRVTEVLYWFLALAATIQQGRRNYPATGFSTQSLSLNFGVIVCPVLVQTQWIWI